MGADYQMVEKITTEIELKLRFAASDKNKLIQALLDLGIELEPETHLYATYYDTPDLLVRNQGIGLRVRKEQDHWVQTIKSIGTATGGLHVRKEVNLPVEGSELDLTKLPVRGRLGQLFEPEKLRSVLKPVVITDMHRRSGRWMTDHDAVVEIALDEGVITAKGASVTLHELELELIHGQAGSLYDLAMRLSQHVDFELQAHNKAEWGYAMISPLAHEPVFADLPVLSHSMTAEDGFAAILERCLYQFYGNHQAVLDGHIEGVHQMRVGLRRLRSCIHVYKQLIPVEMTEPLVKEIRWLNEKLSPIRDWDVFLQSMDFVQSSFPDRKGIPRIVALGKSIRGMHHAQLVERLNSRRFHHWVIQLGDWIHNRRWKEDLRRKQRMRVLKPVEDYAREVLEHLYKRLTHDGKGFDQLPLEAKHALRIRVKRMRYALQFFSDLFGKKSANKLLQALGNLQDDLGYLNDVRVAASLLNEIGVNPNNPSRNFLEGWYVARQVLQQDHAAESWESFIRSPIPWH